MSPLDSSPLEPEDVAHLRGMAGMTFLSPVNLPSGRKLDAEEAQALASAFAPAASRSDTAEVRLRLSVEPYEERIEPRGWLTAVLIFVLMGMAAGCTFWSLSEAFSR